MTFSIITPSFRQSEYLKLCVASVADQGVDHEHIVQDAGSDDGTLTWLRDDDRVQCHVEKDSGMYDAINRGLRKAKGDYLAYLNCDEQYLPGALESVQRYFETHPSVEVIFSDAIVIDPEGDFLFYRKSLIPLAYHTACFPLSTLTCATFFRRKVIENREIYFDPAWRYCGDSVWVAHLIREGVQMAVLRQFTSVFTHTGGNMSMGSAGQEEGANYFAQAPVTARTLRPLILAHHRLRRWWSGIYHQRPFSFEIYLPGEKGGRVRKHAAHPTSRWKW